MVLVLTGHLLPLATHMLNLAHLTTCTECSRPWLLSTERWKAYIADIERPPEVLVFCPDCAQREFGPAE